MRRAHGSHAALLQHAQQLDLQVLRQFTDFVEQHRAAIGLSEQPEVFALRTSKGAFLVAEQLTFHQRLGQRPAVDDQEWLLAAIGGVVDGARHALLAAAALARDEHGRAHVGDALHQIEHGAHGGAAPEQICFFELRDARSQPPVLERELLLLQRLADEHRQLGGVEGLGHEIVRAAAHRADRVLDRGMGGDQDHLGGWTARFGCRQHLHARTIGHRQIGQHHWKRLWMLTDRLERGAAAGCRNHRVPLPPKQDLQHLPEPWLVFDDQQLDGRGDERGHVRKTVAFSARSEPAFACERPETAYAFEDCLCP